MNIYQMAEKAGVSPTTVSRVINKSSHVSDEARAKVEKVIEESGYVPNYFARSLNMKATGMVGILCPMISDLNHACQVASLEKYLRREGFDIILSSLEQNQDSKVKNIDLLMQKHAEALFFIGSTVEDSIGLEELVASVKNLPTIILNGKIDAPNIYCVYSKEKEMCTELVNSLCFSGITRILYLYDSMTFSGKQKLEGYKIGMESCGLEEGEMTLFIPEEISMANVERSRKLIKDYIKKEKRKPEAVIAADDILAVVAQKVTKELHMDIPVIGWNNTMYSSIATPSISSVDINRDKIGKMAVNVLKQVIRGKNAPRIMEIPAKFVERESFKKELL